MRKPTKRQRAKQQILKDKELSDCVINSLPAIFYLFDTTGKMLRWNQLFQTVTGYSADEISKMHPVDFFDEDEKGLIRSRIEEVFIKGVSDADASIFAKDRTKTPYYFTGTSIEFEGKICLIGAGVNMTERQRARAELEYSNQQLRQLAAHMERVREEERVSIAREIHDELGQQISGLKMDIAWLSRKITNQDDAITKKFKDTLELLDKTINTVRRLATELRPSILDDFGLVAALEWQSEMFEKRFHIDVDFKVSPTLPDVPEQIAIAFFRIYQESLTNVARHSGANKVEAGLELKDDLLLLYVHDNGKGFDTLQSGRKTLGLLGMKERSMMLGGNFLINSVPGMGTRVELNVPLLGKEKIV